MINKLLYLGPEGSYSEIAKNKFNKYCNENCEYLSIDSIYKIAQILKLENSNYLGAVIPIENSIEGIVTESQDCLVKLSKLNYRILAETNTEINHSLISYGKKSDIKTIISHPQALAQCREYINKNWDENINLKSTLSTSNAVRNLNSDDLSIGAIASEYCAKLYNIPILDKRINDEKNNKTRFILLSKLKPLKSFKNKVSITFSTKNKPGALNQILKILEIHNLNMSSINSRPSRKELGEYVFYIDFTGHIDFDNVSNALNELKSRTSFLEILSYGAEYV